MGAGGERDLGACRHSQNAEWCCHCLRDQRAEALADARRERLRADRFAVALISAVRRMSQEQRDGLPGGVMEAVFAANNVLRRTKGEGQ